MQALSCVTLPGKVSKVPYRLQSGPSPAPMPGLSGEQLPRAASELTCWPVIILRRSVSWKHQIHRQGTNAGVCPSLGGCNGTMRRASKVETRSYNVETLSPGGHGPGVIR